MKIFISDDSSALRERLCAALSEIKGMNVVGQASTVRETLTAVAVLEPDVLIQDISLREENGLQVVAEIKRLRPKTLVVVLTNHAEPQYQARALLAGADHFYIKSTGWKSLFCFFQQMAAETRTTISLPETKFL